jgi:hypothetical protein
VALVLDGDGAVTTQGGTRIALSAVHLLARRSAIGTSTLFVITRGAQVPRPAAAARADHASAAHAGVWGFNRSVRIEHPQLKLCSHDAGDTTAAHCLIAPQLESEISWLDGTGCVQRLRRHLAMGMDSHASLRGAWLITGGLGGLGLRGAALLSSCGAQLVLSSKSGRVTREGQGLSEALEALHRRVQPNIAMCDSSDCNELVSGLISLASFRGALLAAGTGDVGLLKELEAHRMRSMFTTKVFGTSSVHCATSTALMDARIHFSSLGPLLGNTKLGNYAAANSCLDVMAVSSRACGLAACSVQWPGVSDAGMGAEWVSAVRNKLVVIAGGAHAISLDEYAACLEAQLVSQTSLAGSVQLVHSAGVRELVLDLVDSTLSRFSEVVSEVRDGANSSASTDAFTPVDGAADGALGCAACDEAAGWLAPVAPSQRRAYVESAVLRVVRELSGGAGSLTTDTPLMEADIDSLAATQLSSQMRQLAGTAISPTVVFEQPTPRLIAAHLLELVGGASIVASPVSIARNADAGAALALIGTSGRWPGGCNGDAARWRLQMACGDAVGGVPSLTRWRLEEVVSETVLTSAQAHAVRHGGFVAGAEMFDARSFSLSPSEAGVMDPQQRMLLEVGYAVLHGALLRRATLVGGDSGVFLGIEHPDWAHAQPPSARASTYAVTIDNVSAAAGRVSFVLGLQGPCSTLDTACSSALVAAHWGTHAVRGSESREALTLAVSLKLTPYPVLGAAAAGMVSIDGRCKTLDSRANGYAKGEGIGALMLRMGDGVALSLCGIAVRQDGRSASLTAPNGSAQRTLLLTALGCSALGDLEVGGIEAHGTGTALGDPTEAGALVAVHGAVDRVAPITVGAAKASVAHTEASSGQVGLLRIKHGGGRTAGNSQLRALNPLVGERLGLRACFVLPTQEIVSGLASGVSSFGFSGTIAHAVLTTARSAFGGSTAVLSVLSYRRRAFSWSIAIRSVGCCVPGTSMYAVCWARIPPLVAASPRPLFASTPTAARSTEATPSSSPVALDADLCIVGAGTIGLMVARDTASCSFQSIVLERDAVVGGVWSKNDYPGLRLQVTGASYRCLSLAPAWMCAGEGQHDVLYRPTGKEVLAYLNEMADHALISICTSTSYVRHTASGCHFSVTTNHGQVIVRGIAFAHGAHETTAGLPHMPIDPLKISNGACILHSSGLAERSAAFYGAQTRFVVGASKAAIDILETLDPDDEGVVWAHRGHIVFHNRDRIHAVLKHGGVAPPEVISQAHTGNLFLKNQQFVPAFDGMLKSGNGIYVGLPLAAQPAMRGGVESEASLAFARRFLPRQVLLTTVRVSDEGVLQLCCADGRILSVGRHDAAVLCTGQRASDAGEGSYARRATHNQGGLFHVAPFSNQTPTNSLYMLHCVVSYLKGTTPSAYNDGRIATGFERQAKHIETIKDRGAWARFWANMGGVQ